MKDDGKPGESLKETSTEELKATLAKLKPTDPGSEARIKAIKAELSARTPPDFEKAQPSESTSLTPEKARQMLHERSGGHGRPITEQQRKFFGAVGGHLPAPGSKAKKSMSYEDLDDFLEKAKYTSRKKVGGKWVYTYPDDKKPKPPLGQKPAEGPRPLESNLRDMKAGESILADAEKVAKFHGTTPEAVQATWDKLTKEGIVEKKTVGNREEYVRTTKGVAEGDLPRKSMEKSMAYDDLDDFLEKAKYTSRKKVGGKWVYTYPDDKKGKAKGGAPEAAPEKKTQQEVFKELQDVLKTDPGVKEALGDIGKELMSSLGQGATPEDFKAVQVWMANAGSILASAISQGKVDNSTIAGISTNSAPKHDFSQDVGYRVHTRIGGQVGKFVKTAFNAYQEKHGGAKLEPQKYDWDKPPTEKSMEKSMSCKDLEDYMEKAKYTSRKRVGNRWVYKYAKDTKKKKEAAPGPEAGGAKIDEATAKWAATAPDTNLRANHQLFTEKTMMDEKFLPAGQTKESFQAKVNALQAEMKKRGMEIPTVKNPYEKSLDGFESLEDYLQKSGGLPTHQQGMGHKKSSAVEGGSADGGELADVGRTSGSSDSASGPGQDSQGQLTGVSSGGKQKLSDDDADADKQMSPHKKPIETIKKSAFPADQRDAVAQDRAAAVARLQKSDDVYVGPNRHPYSHELTHASGDAEASELVKSEDFYHGGSPQTAPQRPIIEQGVLCKSINAHGCDSTYSAALTSCPGCGAGTVGHRHLPGGAVLGAETMILEKSIGPGSMLRRPPEEPDVKIG